MRDTRCLLGFHRWVGVRAPKDTPAREARVDGLGITWTGDGLAQPGHDPGHVVWCKRCGKDRPDFTWWMGA